MSRQSQDKLFKVLCDVLEDSITIDEDSLDALINQLSPLLFPDLTDEEVNIVRKKLMTQFSVNMDKGQLLKEKHHKDWYEDAKKASHTHFWDRYRDYLFYDEGFSPNVLKTLSDNSETIVNLLGDPRSPMAFDRRGLVIGDVQSGKTSTYLAIINKAADVQYKIFIVLTGTIEKLRQQTQQRIDSGFLGFDSSTLNGSRDIGVSKYAFKYIDEQEEYEKYESPLSCTDTSSDFGKPGVRGNLFNCSSPVIFIMKKNSKVLASLLDWLTVNNGKSGSVNYPMLLIDDEADNASINTKRNPNEATAINQAIRKLLNLFTKSNYVGFTATPYANIFINPDTDDDMLKEDLFPRDFIYLLKAPSNYLGPGDIFKGESEIDDDGDKIEYGRCHFMLKDNGDMNEYLDVGHKNNARVRPELPVSLKEAIMSFFIVNTILDLRGQGPLHRTMMINVSRFNSVQNGLRDEAGRYVKDIQQNIKLYSRCSNVTKPDLEMMRKVYEKHFKSLNGGEMFTWDEVRGRLYESVRDIQVRTVNNGNSSKSLNYDEYKDDGLRLIAIGGHCLSRGLTLQGLIVSYYNRNSKMYDTLMQMGRWFGYRTGYEDLCQIWMSEEARRWYGYIWSATEELKRDIDQMNAEGKTPKDFGLRVRSDEATLMVTAANKRRFGKDIDVILSYSGGVVETAYLYTDEKINKQNYDLVTGWLEEVLKEHAWLSDTTSMASNSKYQIKGLSCETVLTLLKNYRSHDLNNKFNIETLCRWIENVSDKLPAWDLVIATGKGTNKGLGPIELSPVLRKYAIKGMDGSAYQMSGEKAHLGSKGVYTAGLKKTELSQIENETQKKALSQDDYFKSSIVKRNPLLVIWPVSLKGEDEEEEKTDLAPLIGLSVGCPRLKDESKLVVKYTINVRKQRELLDTKNGDDDKDDEIDD